MGWSCSISSASVWEFVEFEDVSLETGQTLRSSQTAEEQEESWLQAVCFEFCTVRELFGGRMN